LLAELVAGALVAALATVADGFGRASWFGAVLHPNARLMQTKTETRIARRVYDNALRR